MHSCEKCMKIGGALLLIAGVLFLLQDLKVWSFWNLSWFTVLFLIIGTGHLASSGCKDCQAMKKK